MSVSEITNDIAVSLEKVQKSKTSSFYAGIYKQPYFNGAWHYHPELELLLITRGNGKRLVGDHVEDFEENDLVLLGSFLPHSWLPDPKYLEKDSEDYCESIYMQFTKEIFGTSFVGMPEMKGIRKILTLSERGIKISGKYKQQIISLMKEVSKETPFNQLLKLLQMLNLVSLSDLQVLVSEEYLQKSFYFKSNRMVKIHEFLMENYKNEITIQMCADMVNMVVPSFCRFFKNQTKVTFSSYLNKIRIDFSKTLLANTDMAIKIIAYESGYNSVPYFNKQFKKITGVSPFAYRKNQQ